jgi:hypothetical protein
MSRLWQGIVAFWAEREHPAPLAAFRIALGLVVLHTWWSVWWHEVGPLYVAEKLGGFAPDNAAPAWLEAMGGASPQAVDALVWSGMALSALLVIGWGGRVVPLVLGQICMVLFALHSGTGGGHDRLITNGMWMLVLGDGTATWSIDAWRRTGAWSNAMPISSLARRLGVFQLVVMYTLTGLQKQGKAWMASGDYRAVYDTLQLPSWRQGDNTWAADFLWLSQISTIIAWWWETLWVLLGVALLLRHTAFEHTRLGRLARAFDLRPIFVFLGLVTHGFLWITMNLGPFTAVTFAFYLCLITDEDVARWRGRRG